MPTTPLNQQCFQDGMQYPIQQSVAAGYSTPQTALFAPNAPLSDNIGWESQPYHSTHGPDALGLNFGQGLLEQPPMHQASVNHFGFFPGEVKNSPFFGGEELQTFGEEALNNYQDLVNLEGSKSGLSHPYREQSSGGKEGCIASSKPSEELIGKPSLPPLRQTSHLGEEVSAWGLAEKVDLEIGVLRGAAFTFASTTSAEPAADNVDIGDHAQSISRKYRVLDFGRNGLDIASSSFRGPLLSLLIFQKRDLLFSVQSDGGHGDWYSLVDGRENGEVVEDHRA
ncbi:hypothetical protein QBC45DRAFT_432260 [Copromyces sp. CBS 386.78]|nr:hypothetical protein QBC45DRAFT_432260 [Copromyces sp. CBS 386.78]